MRLFAAAIVCSATLANADGYFYEQSYGLSSVRGAMAAGTALHVRLGFGVRVGEVALEPWMAGDLTFDRVGATYGVGGDPAMGHADITGVGFDARWTAPIGHALSIYVRGGPRLGAGDGALSRFVGPGLGAGTGIQIAGPVRALGFLWAPLFWLHKGPKVIGALFLDEGVDWYHLDAGNSAPMDTPIVSTNVGFAIGQDF
jgi:hypothetical protein